MPTFFAANYFLLVITLYIVLSVAELL